MRYLYLGMLALLSCTPPITAKPTIVRAPLQVAAATTMRGVNLSGADFGAMPGTEGKEYTWPLASDVDYFLSKGMNAFRIGFRWERLQPRLKCELEPVYLSRLDALVTYATGKGATVILNPQNFARYNDGIVGTPAVPNDAFADFWSRLAVKYKANSRVIFGLVNEPHDMPTEQWVAAANAAIAAIRAAGATQLISVPGNGWTGAHSWSAAWYGTSNAVAMLKVTDANTVTEIHNYLDTDASGGGKECVSGTIGSERLTNVVAWARKNGRKIWLGEFGAPDTPTCAAAIRDLLTYVATNSDVVTGWTWWSAGSAWGDTYQLSVQPTKAGVERPQLTWLLPFVGCGK